MTTKMIRMLTMEDYPYMKAMDTAIEDDYIKRIFERLTSGPHKLYGMFLDDRLVSVGGYSIFARSYAMLGRLRSDRNYRGMNHTTELLRFVKEEAFRLDEIRWAGANTQEENTAARRVLEKAGLTPCAVLHGAVTKNTAALETGCSTWKPVKTDTGKKQWLKHVFTESEAVFPYECYYPFPASDDLFVEDAIRDWNFYENSDGTRVLITKYDQKKYHYLHAIYPWNDFTGQPGLWETITQDYRKLAAEHTDEETYVWMDLTKEGVKSLPAEHPFRLPSPWILHGEKKPV
ncbi:GNAT family N-acetyltransferase [Alteribacter natronophilus]|uniref:GNAT family N-acetyltransferase n=1 Tax=Alteribacter natronophilus TaxID=2583810 RepID=UPI00110DEA5E|nr:GNAT family N-acetyltransferase [Alteribacter natronophilus]TMW70309.1 GNAT family N-acetyltransferase [Alteribacter natronophilus]